MSLATIIKDTKGQNEVEETIKLRELEIQTQYELKYLTTSFQDLRDYVKEALTLENDKFGALNKKVTILTYIILAQLAGLDMDRLISLFKVIPL